MEAGFTAGNGSLEFPQRDTCKIESNKQQICPHLSIYEQQQ